MCLMNFKIPFYDIVNFFLTGLVAVCGLIILVPGVPSSITNNAVISKMCDMPGDFELIISVFVFACSYEVGLVVNRIGSTVVEPILKKLKLIPFDDNYKLYNERKKEFPIMDVLSREYAVSRTGATLFFLLAFLALLGPFKAISILFLLITALFIISCRKHAAKIVILMAATPKPNK